MTLNLFIYVASDVEFESDQLYLFIFQKNYVDYIYIYYIRLIYYIFIYIASDVEFESDQLYLFIIKILMLIYYNIRLFIIKFESGQLYLPPKFMVTQKKEKKTTSHHSAKEVGRGGRKDGGEGRGKEGGGGGEGEEGEEEHSCPTVGLYPDRCSGERGGGGVVTGAGKGVVVAHINVVAR